jgi:hypothetical protein
MVEELACAVFNAGRTLVSTNLATFTASLAAVARACSTFPSTITRDMNSIIGCVYPISSSARPLFGDNAKAFEAELTEALLSLNPLGVFNEQVETESRHRAQENPVGSGPWRCRQL